MGNVIDVTRLIDMNTHMGLWNTKMDDYTLYAVYTLHDIEIKFEEEGKKLRIKHSGPEKNPFTWHWDDEALALLQFAEANNRPIRVFLSRMLQPWANDALVVALGNNEDS